MPKITARVMTGSLTGVVTDVTQMFSKGHLSVRQGAPQTTTFDI